QLLQSLTKRCDAREHCRIVQGLPEEHPDTSHLLALLRARGERPSSRAAEQCNELSAFQMRRPMFEHRPPPALLVAAYRILSLPPSGGRILGADLNCSE